MRREKLVSASLFDLRANRAKRKNMQEMVPLKSSNDSSNVISSSDNKNSNDFSVDNDIV